MDTAAHSMSRPPRSIFFFYNDPATPEFYPFPLHDALPIKMPAMPPRLINSCKKNRPNCAGAAGGASLDFFTVLNTDSIYHARALPATDKNVQAKKPSA